MVVAWRSFVGQSVHYFCLKPKNHWIGCHDILSVTRGLVPTDFDGLLIFIYHLVKCLDFCLLRQVPTLDGKKFTEYRQGS